MSEADQTDPGSAGEAIQPLLQEARKLIERLEGSTVTRLAVAAGDHKIEIERGLPAAAPIVGAPYDPEIVVQRAAGPGPGPGLSPGGRSVSGSFEALTGAPPTDNRVAVLAPLVGTFYGAAKPGDKPFAEEGDTVESGQTVCIVEAMKLMNEVAATESGRVDEILVENGDWVEFEQVIMYIEPSE